MLVPSSICIDPLFPILLAGLVGNGFTGLHQWNVGAEHECVGFTTRSAGHAREHHGTDTIVGIIGSSDWAAIRKFPLPDETFVPLFVWRRLGMYSCSAVLGYPEACPIGTR